MTTMDLFEPAALPGKRAIEVIAPGASLLRGWLLDEADAVIDAVNAVIAAAPLRHLVTPGGFTMSVAMTNCGTLGWVSDRRGYRYEARDPESGLAWPAMPVLLRDLATRAAFVAGYPAFVPDACLINRYEPGARMSLHQDRDEQDLHQPIVSVSLGLPAVFLLGGLQRNEPTQRIPLGHGDVVAWGGPSRLRFHGVMPLKDGFHARLGRQRMNLTFRKAG